MSANTLLTSVVTGGTNSHATTSEEANSLATDFVTQGVVGAITLNAGSGGTGSFCVNADASPDMGVTIKAGQAYVTATPSSQNSQVLRVRASSDYTTYAINANSSGATKYDWIYLSISASNANNPASDSSNVASFVTSRSSSNTTDNGTPPTYGLLLAIVTVANGASSITNSNVTDKRFNTSIGAQNGSLIVTQQSTGNPAKIQAAGIDANVDVQVIPKGTGAVKGVAENLSNPYKFAAFRNAALTTTAASVVKIPFDSVAFDTNSNFDTTNNWYVVPITGYYQLNASLFITASSTRIFVSITADSTELTRGNDNFGGGDGSAVSWFGKLTAGQKIIASYFTNEARTLAGSETVLSGFLVCKV